tara:strand:- start:15118 stop:15834 length:717 start_codon:yes stop_codon:yes gene_type:complete
LTEAGPLSTPEFATFAADFVLFCHPESTATQAKDVGLAKRLGVTGLPDIAVFTADGTLIVKVPPSVHSVAQFTRYAARARQLLAWRVAANEGDARAAAALLIAQLEERQLDRSSAESRRKQLKNELEPERKRIDALLLDLRIGEQIRAVHRDLNGRRALGGKFLRMLAADQLPSPAVSRGFWFVIMEHCEAKADVDGFVIGLNGLRRNVALTANGAPWGAKLIADYEQKLARLQTGKK